MNSQKLRNSWFHCTRGIEHSYQGKSGCLLHWDVYLLLLGDTKDNSGRTEAECGDARILHPLRTAAGAPNSHPQNSDKRVLQAEADANVRVDVQASSGAW